MDAFNPENELIDRFLRGDLHGQQLDSFMRKLERDPALKQDLEFKQLLVKGIQEQGAINLKNYIRQRTSQKRGMLIGIRTWYYAAAAVLLVLVCAGVILFNMQQHNEFKSELAKQPESIGPQKPDLQIHEPESHPGNQSVAKNSPKGANSGPIELKTPENSGAVADGAGAPATANLDDRGKVSETIAVASNIPVTPIRIESPIETTMAKKFPDKEISREGRTKTNLSDTTLDSKKIEASKTAWANATQSKFKLNFYSTEDATPQVTTTHKSDNSTDILVYNLPYDNPLLFSYQNKMYLKTGNKFYEIDVNKEGAQKVTPVTDQALLKVLNQ